MMNGRAPRQGRGFRCAVATKMRCFLSRVLQERDAVPSSCFALGGKSLARKSSECLRPYQVDREIVMSRVQSEVLDASVKGEGDHSLNW